MLDFPVKKKQPSQGGLSIGAMLRGCFTTLAQLNTKASIGTNPIGKALNLI